MCFQQLRTNQRTPLAESHQLTQTLDELKHRLSTMLIEMLTIVAPTSNSMKAKLLIMELDACHLLFISHWTWPRNSVPVANELFPFSTFGTSIYSGCVCTFWWLNHNYVSPQITGYLATNRLGVFVIYFAKGQV